MRTFEAIDADRNKYTVEIRFRVASSGTTMGHSHGRRLTHLYLVGTDTEVVFLGSRRYQIFGTNIILTSDDPAAP